MGVANLPVLWAKPPATSGSGQVNSRVLAAACQDSKPTPAQPDRAGTGMSGPDANLRSHPLSFPVGLPIEFCGPLDRGLEAGDVVRRSGRDHLLEVRE